MRSDSAFQYSVASVDRLGRSGVVDSHSTGFLVARDLVLTTLHGIADTTTDPPTFFEGNIRVTFNGPRPRHETPAKPLNGYWDPRGDWVLLECANPPTAPVLSLARLESSEVPWRGFGFPQNASEDGLMLRGKVTSWDHHYRDNPVFQLFCEQATQRLKIKGASGSPVLVGDAVVGHLRTVLLDGEDGLAGQTLFSSRAADLEARCADRLIFRQSPYDDRLSDNRVLPELQPFLTNRTLQLAAVRDAVSKKRARNRPIVIVVHGTRDQSHDQFVEQLLLELPGFLHVERERLRDWLVRWPVLGPGQHHAAIPELFERELASELLDRDSSRAELAEALRVIPGPSVIRTYLTTTTCREWSELASLLTMWDSWPDTGNHPLFVVLSITYSQPPGLWSRFTARRAASRLRKALLAPPVAGLNLEFLVLPELDSVTQVELEGWARLDSTRACCNLTLLMSEIQNLFRRWWETNGTHAIPMEHLAREVRDLMEQCRLRERRSS